jgi:hypothetical protein
MHQEARRELFYCAALVYKVSAALAKLTRLYTFVAEHLLSPLFLQVAFVDILFTNVYATATIFGGGVSLISGAQHLLGFAYLWRSEPRWRWQAKGNSRLKDFSFTIVRINMGNGSLVRCAFSIDSRNLNQ